MLETKHFIYQRLMKNGSSSAFKFFCQFASSMCPKQDSRCNLEIVKTYSKKVGQKSYFVYNEPHERVCERKNPFNKPIYATIRNPFGWYHSFYLHCQKIWKKWLSLSTEEKNLHGNPGRAYEYYLNIHMEKFEKVKTFESFIKDYIHVKGFDVGFFTYFLSDFTLNTNIKSLIIFS